MTLEIQEKLYTVEEFLNLEWDDDDEDEYELIEGKIVAKPKSGVSAEHGKIVARVVSLLDRYAGYGAGEKRLGEVYSGASCTLGRPVGSNYVEPDACFVLDGRTPTKFSGAIPVAPDIVVEVWSPSDTTQKIHDKVKAYKEAGVGLIWSIYMLDQYVVIYRANDPNAQFLAVKGELDGGDALPGFKLKVSQLFE